MTLGGATNYLFAVTASLLHHSLSRWLSQCHSYLREDVQGTWTEDIGCYIISATQFNDI